MQAQLKHMLEKLQTLPPERLAEVEDFVDFLRQREQEKSLQRDYQQAAQARFSQVWDNDEDAAYN